ncbi:hypothetical protein E3N88_06782 [Mikania micrantha]|uniref:Uncharacterized protein n=1 Tax=Mikania micrantha TaxID=192012 RepID=A0A5N6PQY5_9ASTR|nr:hypothetical protein E3N88_06782 [Mikania micrantha]
MPYESRFQLHFSNPHENFKSYLSSSFCSPDEYESVAPPPMVAAAMWCTGVSIPLRIGKASNFESGRDEYHRLRCSFVHSLISMEEEASGTLPHQGLNNSDGSNEGRVSSPNEGIAANKKDLQRLVWRWQRKIYKEALRKGENLPFRVLPTIKELGRTRMEFNVKVCEQQRWSWCKNVCTWNCD